MEEDPFKTFSFIKILLDLHNEKRKIRKYQNYNRKQNDQQKLKKLIKTKTSDIYVNLIYHSQHIL